MKAPQALRQLHVFLFLSNEAIIRHQISWNRFSKNEIAKQCWVGPLQPCQHRVIKWHKYKLYQQQQFFWCAEMGNITFLCMFFGLAWLLRALGIILHEFQEWCRAHWASILLGPVKLMAVGKYWKVKLNCWFWKSPEGYKDVMMTPGDQLGC